MVGRKGQYEGTRSDLSTFGCAQRRALADEQEERSVNNSTKRDQSRITEMLDSRRRVCGV